MGFLDKLFGSKDKSLNSSSIILDIEKMRQKLIVVTLMQKEKGLDLESKLQGFEDKIKGNTTSEVALQQEFKEFKEEFNKTIELYEGKYLFNEVDTLQKELDKIFHGESTDTQNYNSIFETLEERLNTLDNRKTYFSGTKQQLYIAELIKTKYKIDFYKIIVNYPNYNYSNSKIKKAPNAEKIIYTSLLFDDIRKLYNILSQMDSEYGSNKDLAKDLSNLEKNLDEFVKELSNRYPENLELSSIFNDTSLMKNFIDIAHTIRTTKEIIKQQYLDILKKEQEEKEYQTITEEDMRNKIKEIDNSSFDVTQSYKNILEYQKAILKARNLLNEKNEMLTTDISFFRFRPDELGIVINENEKSKIAYTILPEADDSPVNNCIIAISQANSKKFKNNSSIVSKFLDENSLKALVPGHNIIGKYGKSFIYAMYQEPDNTTLFDSDGNAYYDLSTNRSRFEIEHCYEKILSENNIEAMPIVIMEKTKEKKKE